MSKAIKIILLCLGIFLLFALAYRVGFSEIIEIISGAKLYLAFSGLLVYLMGIFARSCKWFILTKIIKNEISYRRFFPFYLVNSLIGNLTPFKLGEGGTPLLFRKYLKIPISQGFSIIVLDRFFELVIFVLISVFAVFFMLNQEIQEGLILSIFRLALVILFLLLAISIIIIVSKKITLKAVKFFRVLGFVEKGLDGFYEALLLFKNKSAYQLIALLTLISWFFEILAYWLVFSSVFSVPFITFAAAQIVAGAATIVSFVPAGVGVGEVSVVYVLGLLDYPLALTASGVILASFFLNGALLITGLAGLVLVRKEERNALKGQ